MSQPSTTSRSTEPERRVAPTGPSPGDPAGIGSLAYAVHADHLASTRSAAASAGADAGSGSQSAAALLQAALRLTSSLEVPEALQRLVSSACSITGAAWGTIAVRHQADVAVDPDDPVSSGAATTDTDSLHDMLHDAVPTGPAEGGVVIANDLGAASAFTGAIEGEGSGSLLSAPLSAHGQVYGRLYLCDKAGGFGPDDVTTVLTLAEAAALAVENARLYREARDREQWMSVSQELTTLLLSGADEDDALTLIAHRVREVAHASTSVLVLPSVGDSWVCEIADGERADELIGVPFPRDGRALSTLDHQAGFLVPSLHDAWGADDLKVSALSVFGPALYAPMIHRGRGVGVMLLLREVGSPVFTEKDLEIAELVAGQATMAFELADAKHAEEMATLLDERARIGRDLHDLAIQQLFATGMQITAAKQRLRDRAPGESLDVEAVCAALDSSLAAVDDSVGQIRSIVRSLRDRDEDVSVVERLRREASLARTSLGYAPSLVLSVDGQDVSKAAERDAEDELIDAVEAAVDPDVADDMVAVVREGLSNIARHAHASSATVDILLTGVLPGGSVLVDGAEVAGGAPAAPDVEGSLGPAEHPVVEIVCRDDGVGVDPAVTRRSGTANMAERARRHGGTFVIGPRAHSDGERRGTCFTWRVPLDTSGRRR
ncbi:histidine kinase [Actinomyces radicidentis]|uniref:Histidine kinase n=1 Tax=Actinomyces radicidentis TaxID=111015 RepID=A0A109W377_ACTRD|nr:GAF domain-containing protein [Actinomyces radicidentis]AMD88233.1 histidine kinase [Actinomyces radicidentis]